MTWFKVDDALHSHRKAVRAGVPAMGLWVLAGSWCADHLSDGFIPDYMAERIDRDYEENAARLVAAGLWAPAEKDGDKGWQFHQWVEQQPTREEAMAASSRKSSGGKLGNHRRWHVAERKTDPHCQFCQTGSDQPEMTEGSHAGRLPDRSSDRLSDRATESGPNPPTRPDPSRPGKEQTPSGSAALPSASAPLTDTQRSKRITDAYAEVEPMCRWPAVNGVVLKAIKSKRFADEEIKDALVRMAQEGRSVTVDALRTELQGFAARGNDQGRAGSELARRGTPDQTRRSTSAARAEQALSIADELDRQNGHGRYAPEGTR
jgi:hypothetical protein